MTDEDIIKYYQNRNIHSWKNIPNEHKEYLDNRFNDSQSYKESIWRILYNIEERPICKICGNPVNFIGKKNNIFSKTCSKECFLKILSKELSEEEKYYKSLSRNEKTKYTCQKKYGVDYPAYLSTNNFKTNNPLKNKEIKEKIKQTRINKYGQYMSPNNIKSLQSENIKNKRKKSFINTMLNKYGDINYRNLKKHKQTCLEKYNVDSYSKTDEWKLKIENKYNIIQEKRNNTLKQNNSYNKSSEEELSYELLKEKYPDVLRQYKSDVYPFACDFYIPSLDFYIECNYHWTHGGKLYEGTEKDNKLLQNWKNKNTKYYNNAIKTWMYYDIKKYNTAKENKLNYLLFYNINELKNWLKK